MQEADRQSYTVELTDDKGERVTKRLLLDQNAVSSDPAKPAFLTPPAGSKPYYGFPLVETTCKDGFCYGAVTDYLHADSPSGCSIGDGYVEAPDGTRAGVFWEVKEELGYSVIDPPDETRWGIYYFGIEKPISSLEDLTAAFHLMLPKLKELHASSLKE